MMAFKNKTSINNLFSVSKKVFFLIVFAFFLSTLMLQIPYSTNAYDTSCPSDMTDQACLDYLQEQAKQITSEKSQVSTKISSEEYAQLDLYDKISFYASQIAQSEKNIDEMQIILEQKAVETRLLNKDIELIQNNIDTASAEINRLKATLHKRIALSYKYSSITALDMLLGLDEIENLMRRLRYLQNTREKDEELLFGMSDQIEALSEEQEILGAKKVEVQKIQEEAEVKRSELYEEKVELDQQKSEHRSLLGQSQSREQQYRDTYAELEQAEDQATQRITQLIFELYKSGTIQANTPVNAGDIIGFQGNSGFSTGSHLHFEYRRNGYVANPNSYGCLGVSYGAYAVAGSCIVPVDGGYVTQFPHSYNSAVDLVSFSSGEQPGRFVSAPAVSCYGLYLPDRIVSTRGMGAPIRAVKSGKVTSVRVDACGGKYVIVDHGNGEASLYLHLN